MINTYNFLKNTITKGEKFKQMDDISLCKLYQDTKNEEIITYEFCKHLKLWLRISQRFKNLPSSEDIPSLVLIAIERALRTFDLEKNIKFITYVGTVVFRELENKIYFSAKRNINCISLEDTVGGETEDITYQDIIKDERDIFNEFEIRDYLEKAPLKKEELELCKILMESNSKISNKELAETLNKHRHTIRNIKISLKSKLVGLKEFQTYIR